MAAYNTKDGPKVGSVRNMVMGQWPRMAASGAPYDFYLAEDVYREPDVLRRYKAVALGAFLVLDARQKALMANHDFVSIHCIVPGKHEFRLPFPAKVVNVKSGREEQVVNGVLLLNVSAGETCWFRLYRI